MPTTIVSDIDSLFIGEGELYSKYQAPDCVCMSTAYHLYSDGFTERVNQCLQQYLRSTTSQIPKNWAG